MKRLKILIFLLCSLCMSQLMAQSSDYSIDLYSYNGGNYVALRWYPQSVDILRHAKQSGFVVQRKEMGSSTWSDVFKGKPASYELFDSMSEKNDQSMMIGFVLYQEELEEKFNADSIKSQMEIDSIEFDMNEYKKPQVQDYLYKLGLVSCEFDLEIAKAVCLYYKDENVTPHAIYDYRVILGDGKYAEKARVVRVNMDNLSQLPSLSELKTETNGELVHFNWNVTDVKRNYSGYFLERSKDGVNYIQVNNYPIVYTYTEESTKNLCLTSDSLPECDKTFYYRICGITPFGVKGPYSNVVNVMNECAFLVNVKIDDVTINRKNVAEIKWSVENPKNQAISGFHVQRVDKMNFDPQSKTPIFNNITSKILSAKTHSYVDKNTHLTNYYRVVAYGKKNGQVSTSNVIFRHQIDSIPPVAPTGLAGTIDSLGVARLTWNKNPESDILGYRVFKSNDSKQDFFSCSDTILLSNFYMDTLYLGTLTNDIYYKVMAIDFNYNQSSLSEMVKLIKPDTIAPAKAVFTEIKQNEKNNFVLHWINSPSSDLQKVELFRKITAQGEWKKIASWNKPSFVENFKDTTSSFKGEMVFYNLVSYDDSNNQSITEGVPVKSHVVRTEGVTNVKITKNYSKGGIRISWENVSKNIDAINIFRIEDGKSPKLIGSFYPERESYFDDKVFKGKKYKYLIQPKSRTPLKAVYTSEVTF